MNFPSKIKNIKTKRYFNPLINVKALLTNHWLQCFDSITIAFSVHFIFFKYF
jgi:hypothetical protein